MTTPDLADRLDRFVTTVSADIDLATLPRRVTRRRRRRVTGTGIAMLTVLAVAVPLVPQLSTTPTPYVTAPTEVTAPFTAGEVAHIVLPEAAQMADAPSVPVFGLGADRRTMSRLAYVDGPAFGVGVTVVAGHRTVFGAPFYELDAVRVGDQIEVELANGTHRTWTVVSTDVIPADADPLSRVTHNAHGDKRTLVLTTPTPRFTSDVDQLVVVATRP